MSRRQYICLFKMSKSLNRYTENAHQVIMLGGRFLVQLYCAEVEVSCSMASGAGGSPFHSTIYCPGWGERGQDTSDYINAQNYKSATGIRGSFYTVSDNIETVP